MRQTAATGGAPMSPTNLLLFVLLEALLLVGLPLTLCVIAKVFKLGQFGEEM